jgi:hypothetical protein
LITGQYLQILNVDENDEATYACTIRNAIEMKTASASLTVFCEIKHSFFIFYSILSIE